MKVLLTSMLLLLLGPGPRTSADAIIRTQAMLASTIAEYFVEDGRIYVELEIGLPDLEAFRNLLPDDIYEKLGHAPVPLQQRLSRFFEQDLVIEIGRASCRERV